MADALAEIVDAVIDGNARARLAVGGGRVHRLVVEKLDVRKAPVSVGPTALTPFRPGIRRFTAPLRLQAFSLIDLVCSDDPSGPDGENGELCDLSVSQDYADKEDFQRWWQHLHANKDFRKVVSFWESADVVLLGVVPLDRVYDDVASRLKKVGTSIDQLKRRGAVGLCANQFFDAKGEAVDRSGGRLLRTGDLAGATRAPGSSNFPVGVSGTRRVWG